MLHRPNAIDQYKAIQRLWQGKLKFTFVKIICWNACNSKTMPHTRHMVVFSTVDKRLLVMSNSNQNTNPFLAVEMAGKDVAIAQQDAARSVMAVAVETIKKNVHTKEDAKAFLTGYADQIATTNKDSVKSLKSRMARIVKVLIVSDDKLNEYHKLSKPVDGQKLIAKLSKKCDGLKPLYDALAIPSAEPVSGESESESEPTDDNKESLTEMTIDYIKRARKNGYTTDEMIATLTAELVANQ